MAFVCALVFSSFPVVEATSTKTGGSTSTISVTALGRWPVASPIPVVSVAKWVLVNILHTLDLNRSNISTFTLQSLRGELSPFISCLTYSGFDRWHSRLLGFHGPITGDQSLGTDVIYRLNKWLIISKINQDFNSPWWDETGRFCLSTKTRFPVHYPKTCTQNCAIRHVKIMFRPVISVGLMIF